MGDYSYGEHMELFGGPPEPGESYPSLEDVDALRKAAKEDPPEPRCVVCDRETHTFEEMQACRSMLKRTDTAEIEEWRG